MTKEQKNLYNKALRYANKVNYRLAKDLVHDAYVAWYNKTGKNLFDEPEHTVMGVVKFTFLISRRKRLYSLGKFMWRGEKHNMYSVPFQDGVEPNEDGIRVCHKKDWLDPQDYLEGVELENYMLQLPLNQLRIYLYAVQGYSQIEISKLLGVSQQAIHYHFKLIRDYAAIFN